MKSDHCIDSYAETWWSLKCINICGLWLCTGCYYPFCAEYTWQQYAQDHQDGYLLDVSAVKKSCCMDDLMPLVKNISKAKYIKCSRSKVDFQLSRDIREQKNIEHSRSSSIPRVKLMGAVISLPLSKQVCRALDVKVQNKNVCIECMPVDTGFKDKAGNTNQETQKLHILSARSINLTFFGCGCYYF